MSSSNIPIHSTSWTPCHSDGGPHGMQAPVEGYCKPCHKMVPLELESPLDPTSDETVIRPLVLAEHARVGSNYNEVTMCFNAGSPPDEWPDNTIDPWEG